MRTLAVATVLVLGLTSSAPAQIIVGSSQDRVNVPINTRNAVAPFPQAQLTGQGSRSLLDLLPAFVRPGSKPRLPRGSRFNGPFTQASSDYFRAFQAQSAGSK